MWHLATIFLGRGRGSVDRHPLTGFTVSSETIRDPSAAHPVIVAATTMMSPYVNPLVLMTSTPSPPREFVYSCLTVIDSCRSRRLRWITGSTTSPHCTQRFAASASSPALCRRSMQKSPTMSPPHLVHDDP